MNAPEITKLSPVVFMLVLAMIALMQLSTDLYTPSFPALQNQFSTNLSQVQLSLSLFLVGFSCAHFLYGPWSDKIGRKKPLLVGIGINVIGSLICIFSPSIVILIIGRFLQGLGIACCNSVGRSLARDLLRANELARVGATVGMVSVLFLALSPTLGGYLQTFFGWRASFIFLLLFGLVLMLVSWSLLPETNKNLNPLAMQLQTIKANSLQLLSNRIFLGYTFCACFSSAGIVAYLAIAPFVLQQKLGLSPIEFGWLAFIVAGGIFLSGLLNHLFVMKKGIQFMLLVGCFTMLVAGLFMLGCIFTKVLSVYTIMSSVGLYSVGAGLTFMNAFPGAFDPFLHIAGTTGALYAFMQDATAAFVSSMIAWLSITTVYTLGWSLTILSSLSLISYLMFIRKNEAIQEI